MTNPTRRALLTAMAALGGAAAGFAQRPARRGPRGGDFAGRQLNEMKERLDLTPGQEAEIRPILEENAEKMMALRGQGRPGQGGPPPGMMEEMRKIREETDAKLGKILSSEQMEQYRKMQEERRPWGGEKGGRGRRPER